MYVQPAISRWIRKFYQLLENLKNVKYTLPQDNIRGAALAYIQLISKYNKEIQFSLCVIGVFKQYKRKIKSYYNYQHC